MIIVNGWKPLTMIRKCSILHVVAALDPSLIMTFVSHVKNDNQNQPFSSVLKITCENFRKIAGSFGQVTLSKKDFSTIAFLQI